MTIDRIPSWFDDVLCCAECRVASLYRGASEFVCPNCRSKYPVVNGVPMLLKPSSMIDTSVAISKQIGGVSPEDIQTVFGTALRYRLNDTTLRSEFSNIVDRYTSIISAPPSTDRHDAADSRAISLTAEYLHPYFEAGTTAYRSFRVRNQSTSVFATSGPKPFNLSYKLSPINGGDHPIEGPRSPFPVPLGPGHEITVPLKIEAPKKVGRYTIKVMLVQEFVTWHANTPVFEGEIVVRSEPSMIDGLVTPPHAGFFDFGQDIAKCGDIIARATKLVRSRVGDERPLRVLEIACGNDPQTLRHFQPNTYVIACDLAFPQVQLACLTYARSNGVDMRNYAFASADVFDTPFKANSFDLIVVCAALHHFADVVAALRQLKSQLSTAGRIVLLREPGKVFPEDATFIAELSMGFNEQQFELVEYEEMFARAGLTAQYKQLDFECSYKVILAG